MQESSCGSDTPLGYAQGFVRQLPTASRKLEFRRYREGHGVQAAANRITLAPPLVQYCKVKPGIRGKQLRHFS
jgi:hypothetical protein